MKKLLFAFMLLSLFSCTKKKNYKCKSNCITVSITGQMEGKNNAVTSMKTPYSILFMPANSSWVDFAPDKEFVVSEGYTDDNGKMQANVKISSADLNADYSLYVRYFPTAYYHFCDNPPLHEIAKVPIDNIDIHTMAVYEKKKITIHAENVQQDTFDTKEILFGAPTECSTNGFFTENSVVIKNNETIGDYTVYALINKMNIITIKKTKIGSPNTYEWINDSVYVDAGVNDFSIQY